MRRAAAVIVPLAVVLALALWRAQGPEPKPAGAPDQEFSAGRGMKVLQSLVVDNVPHPLGTRTQERYRSRLLTQLRALGYDATVQHRFACNWAGACGDAQNVIARLPHPRRTDIVLLMAHYDSVAAGPGAMDDSSGVAALLEIARAVRNERFRNPVAFLFTDGEEPGLFGAEAFVADAELSRDVAAVINVETRGTYGVSNMFETSQGNRWLVRHLANALERPQATSFHYAIYTLLPNDTDLTIFKRAGKAAVNFGAIRGVNWYHTPYDDLAHASARTLQHHGDNALSTLRALANADLDARSKTDATFFDVLGFRLIWWPQEWTLWIGIASLILLVIAARKSPPREMTYGVLTAFVSILLAGLIGFGASWIAKVRSEGINYVAHPDAAVAAMWVSGLAAALIAAALFRQRAKPLPMLYGIAIVWNMIGIALAIALPGAAFLFIVPSVALTICALSGADVDVTSIVSVTAAAILLFPMGLTFYDALGARFLIAIAILIGMLSTLIAPLFARMSNGIAAIIAAIALAIFAMLQPPYDAEKPRLMSISYVDDAAAKSPQWIVPTLNPQFASAANFTRADNALTPWTSGGLWAAPAPQAVQRVSLTGTRNGETLTLRVRSSRNANRLNVLVHGDAQVLRVNGVALPPRPARFIDRMPQGWHYASAHGVQEMIVECSARGRVDVVAGDLTFGLPAAGAALREARHAATAIPANDGDVTITRVRVSF